MPRRPNILYFIGVGLIFTVGALLVSATIEDRRVQAPLAAVVVTSTPTPEPTAMVEPAPTPEPPPPVPSGPPDRAVCAEIRGTAYRSDTERDWFLANCAVP